MHLVGWIYLLVGLSLVTDLVQASVGLPSSMKRCKWQDEACVVDQANIFFKAFKNGIPERQVASMDPLELGTMRIESGGHSDSLQFKLTLSDSKLYNFAQSVKVKGIKGFSKDLTKPLKITVLMQASDLEVRAKYDVDGKLLILPIVSTGTAVIKLSDVHSKSRILVEPVKRSDGHTYLNVTDFRITTKLRNGSFNMSNLFNDNVELRESTLKVLNQEWDALAADVQPAFNVACGRSFKNILQGLWNDIPYDEFFEDE
ncbi:circadian clock-controlled protein daywake [Drosophila bipectinata]|uniref:circadian clock-controlled protein daywake n=1 Tax=Drosophila bipectinata TaxID=42026 RepID=UPI001C89A966|nr:circadian clock-controlled protein daywake [Drosophila bipectinata]